MDGEIEALAIFKAGILFSLERVNREKERVIAEKLEDNGCKRVTEGEFMYKFSRLNPEKDIMYFAFVSKTILNWFEARYDLTPEPAPEEDSTF